MPPTMPALLAPRVACLVTLMLTLLAQPQQARAQINPLPTIANDFCDSQRDFQTDVAGNILPNGELNYTLCMSVKTKSYSITCTKGVRCPPGPDVAHIVYTDGVSYSIDWAGTCTRKPCQNLAQCDPPNGMPFSFLLLDDDSRGIAQRVGPTTLDGLAVEHWQHLRVPGMLMNWYVRNLSSSGDVAPSAPTTWALVRNSFNHSIPGQPAGVGARDFHLDWVSPAPTSSFLVPKACAHAAAGAPQQPGAGLGPAEAVELGLVDSSFGDRQEW